MPKPRKVAVKWQVVGARAKAPCAAVCGQRGGMAAPQAAKYCRQARVQAVPARVRVQKRVLLTGLPEAER